MNSPESILYKAELKEFVEKKGYDENNYKRWQTDRKSCNGRAESLRALVADIGGAVNGDRARS